MKFTLTLGLAVTLLFVVPAPGPAHAAPGDLFPVAGTGIAGPAGDGGPALAAQLNGPYDVAVDAHGNLFIADSANHRVRRVDAVTGIITTVAGNGLQGFAGDGGPAAEASFDKPEAIAVDGAGNLFIMDTVDVVGDPNRGTGRVRRVDAVTGIITTVAGNGIKGDSGDNGRATEASFTRPTGIAVDGDGNLFIADQDAARVRRVDAAWGIITTVAGNGIQGGWITVGDGRPATLARLAYPRDVAVDSAGNLFISEEQYGAIRRVDGKTGIISSVVGPTGKTTYGIETDGADQVFYTTEYRWQIGWLRLRTIALMRLLPATGQTEIMAPNVGDWEIGIGGDSAVYVAAASSQRVMGVEGVAVARKPEVSNQPPVADAGPDRILECTGNRGADVQLDGSGSRDDDGDALSYLWSGPFGTAQGVSPTVFLEIPDARLVTLEVDDGNGGASSDSAFVTVADRTAPLLDAGPDVVLAATGPEGAAYDVAGQVTASDLCDSVNLSITPASPYPPGDTRVQVVASDPTGNRSEATVTVSVRYGFGGFLPPLVDGKAYQAGRTLPVRFALFLPDGTPVRTRVTLSLARRMPDGSFQPVPVLPAGRANVGNLFRYAGLFRNGLAMRYEDGRYIYNLSTRNLQPGDYRLTLDAGDGSAHTLDLRLVARGASGEHGHGASGDHGEGASGDQGHGGGGPSPASGRRGLGGRR